MDFEFLKQRYDFELSRRDAITAALGLPFAILTAVGSLAIAVIRSFGYQRHPWITVGFLMAVAWALLLFIAAIYYLSHAYRDDTYTYLPKLAELEAARQMWRGDDGFFRHELRELIIEAADYNATTNDNRSAYLGRANAAIVWLAASVGAAAVAFAANQVLPLR